MRPLLLLALVLAAGAAQAQQMYRWLDKDGKVHYGNNPPAGVAAKAVKDASNVAVPQHAAPSASQNAHALGRDDDSKPRRIDPKKQY